MPARRNKRPGDAFLIMNENGTTRPAMSTKPPPAATHSRNPQDAPFTGENPKKPSDAAPPNSNQIKDPDDWVTGEEPMTGAQASYLKTLSEEAKEPFDDKLTKAEASKRIDELQERTGRGKSESR